MLSPDEMWRELVFQSRLHYLAFKRSVWMFETLMVAVVAVVVYMLPLHDWARYCLIAFAVARALTEALNHYVLAKHFNAVDKWHLFPFALSVH